MTALRGFTDLPPRHVAASRLAWRISRAIVAREQGWSLESLAASRRWRFQVAGSRCVALAHVSFFFHKDPRGPGAVYAIDVEGSEAVSASARSKLVGELASRLKMYGTYDGRGLVRRVMESRPRLLLAEIDLIAAAFGSNDRHRAPPSRARAPEKRLSAIAEEILAHGAWNLETPSVWLWRGVEMSAAISPMPRDARDRVALATMLHVAGGRGAQVDVIRARAESRGYLNHAGEGAPGLALMKLQSLSLRAALSEARYMEDEVFDRHVSASRRGVRARRS